MLALDTETFLIAPGLLAPPLVCVSLSDGADADLYTSNSASEMLTAIGAMQEKIVGHNIAYDMAVLAEQYPELRPQIWSLYEQDRITDTGIRQRLIDIAHGDLRRKGYSLAALVERHLRIELPKADTWRLRYAELADVPLLAWPPEAKQYALDDAHATWHVWQAQERHAALLADQFRQTRSAFWLHLAACWGLRTGAARVEDFARDATHEYLRLARVLTYHGLKRADRINAKGRHIEGARDTKEAGIRLGSAYALLGKPCPLTETGKPRLDETACLESGDPLLADYARFATTSKVLRTDVTLLERGTYYPIQARFQSLLETGRTSSSPNIQNLPREGAMRECFVPRPGFIFAACDYAAMEIRTLAQVCVEWFGGGNLATALNAGLDPHLEVAAQIVGCSYEEAVRRKAADEPAIKRARDTAKVANFGFPGGLGPTRLVHFAKAVYGVAITESQARALKNRWFSAWPEMRDYFASIDALIDERTGKGKIEQLYSKRIRGGVSFCEACNSPFQGLAADAAKAAGWEIAKQCYLQDASPLFGSRVVNFIHDEFILEVPEEGAHLAAQALAATMVSGAQPWLPDVAVKVGAPVLMRRWSKNAQPVFNAKGELIPWE